MPGTSEVIRFPDAETVLIAFLNTELTAASDAARASGRVPSPRPARFVRVMRTGGPATSFWVDRPYITVEAWDDNEAAAEDLAGLCRSFVWAAYLAGEIDGIPVYDLAEFGGPQRLPDPTTGQTRYTFTFSIELRGTAA